MARARLQHSQRRYHDHLARASSTTTGTGVLTTSGGGTLDPLSCALQYISAGGTGGSPAEYRQQATNAAALGRGFRRHTSPTARCCNLRNPDDSITTMAFPQSVTTDPAGNISIDMGSLTGDSTAVAFSLWKLRTLGAER